MIRIDCEERSDIFRYKTLTYLTLVSLVIITIIINTAFDVMPIRALFGLISLLVAAGCLACIGGSKEQMGPTAYISISGYILLFSASLNSVMIFPGNHVSISILGFSLLGLALQAGIVFVVKGE